MSRRKGRRSNQIHGVFEDDDPLSGMVNMFDLAIAAFGCEMTPVVTIEWTDDHDPALFAPYLGGYGNWHEMVHSGESMRGIAGLAASVAAGLGVPFVDVIREAESRPSQREMSNAARQVANVREEQRGIVITLSGEVLFATGQAVLLPIAQQRLDIGQRQSGQRVRHR